MVPVGFKLVWLVVEATDWVCVMGNCPPEGTNNKIKTAYGYRDQEFFKLRILGIHEAKYALTG